MQETQWTLIRSLGQENPPGVGNGYILQDSCLKNPMENGAWQLTVHGLQSRTQLSTRAGYRICGMCIDVLDSEVKWALGSTL